MASTYSDLKFELIGTGEQSGTWGVTTNTNLGTAIEEAITGSANVTFASAQVTLTLTDTNASQTARNLRLNLTGTSGGAQNLIVPAIEKLYLVNNGCADAITVKNSTGTGIAVPAGKAMLVFNDGTNVVEAITYATTLAASGANSDITSLSGLTTALSIAQGGTGATTALAATQNLSVEVGVDVQAYDADLTAIGGLAKTDGNFIVGNGSTWVAESGATARTSLGLGDMATQSASSVSITGGSVTGITDLAVADGGTGASSFTANSVLVGNGTSSFNEVAPGSNGNVLTSNGTSWVSQAAASGYEGPSSQVYTSSGTFTVPSGITKVKVRIIGGGGSGGQGQSQQNAGLSGGGGGAGGYTENWVTGLSGGQSIPVTVGGAAQASSFGGYWSAGGGGTGSPAPGPTGGQGGTGQDYGALYNSRSNPGDPGSVGQQFLPTTTGGSGGATNGHFGALVAQPNGPGQGAYIYGELGSRGGASGTSHPTSGWAGLPGVRGGGGGGGGSTHTGTRQGGAGGSGIVIVEY